MRHLPPREPIRCWDAIGLGGSSCGPVDTTHRRRCLAPWPFPLQTTGCKSGPRTHPWTTGKDPLSGRPELLVGRRDAHRLGLSREPEQAPWSSAKSYRNLPTTPVRRAMVLDQL